MTHRSPASNSFPLPAPPPEVRGRVIAHLAGEQAAPLALVVAPAGYGKSILLAQHAAAFPGQVLNWRPHRGAHAPSSLLNRVSRQLHGTGPGLGPEVGPWEGRASVESVLVAIERRPNPVLLVVDDSHLIHGSAVEAAVEEMALLAPANLRIVLAGRRHPAINLARHELSGTVVVTPRELALDAAEIRDVLLALAHDGADIGRLDALTRLTEGWPVALRLCAQLPRRAARSAAALADTTLASAAVRGYLDREVLGVLPPGLARDFERVCRTSPGRWLHDDGTGTLDELDSAYGLVRRRADGRYDCVPLLREHVRRRSSPVAVVPPAHRLLPPDDGPPPVLHLRCFRRFQATFGDREIDWRSTRPRVRALARLLAVHAGQPVHRERLMAALWPDSPERTAARGLQVALSALRTFLEPGADRGRTRLLLRSGEAYMIALPPGGSCDVLRFEAAVTTGLRACALGAGGAEQAAESLGLALRLYTGELLPEDGPAEWVVPLREHYRSQAVRAAHALAEVELGRGRPAAAVAAAGAGLSVDPFQDAVWRLLVTAHREAGDPAAAHQASLRHARVLAELELPPRGLTGV
ncbi:BTAD domain-containing putative transcriptional regulator [Streptomyces sp. NPDC049040]|uniref:BTAD domain-containing putative transcriptional regulator n=1 Tax=Streptomyces sp. NPDC049040 TaxID=3365593 RepID=UPI0037104198